MTNPQKLLSGKPMKLLAPGPIEPLYGPSELMTTYHMAQAQEEIFSDGIKELMKILAVFLG